MKHDSCALVHVNLLSCSVLSNRFIVLCTNLFAKYKLADKEHMCAKSTQFASNTYVMCFFLPRDVVGILILRKMRKNEKV